MRSALSVKGMFRVRMLLPAATVLIAAGAYFWFRDNSTVPGADKLAGVSGEYRGLAGARPASGKFFGDRAAAIELAALLNAGTPTDVDDGEPWATLAFRYDTGGTRSFFLTEGRAVRGRLQRQVDMGDVRGVIIRLIETNSPVLRPTPAE